MAKALDLSLLTPEQAAQVLKRRAQKKREYQRRKETLLARNRQWRDANPEKARAVGRKWRDAHPEQVATGKRRWYEANRELQLKRAADRHAQLVDSVVKSRYCQGSELQSQDIPDELVPAIRTTILINRELKEQKRELRRPHPGAGPTLPGYQSQEDRTGGRA